MTCMNGETSFNDSGLQQRGRRPSFDDQVSPHGTISTDGCNIARWQSVVLQPVQSIKVSHSCLFSHCDQHAMTQKGELKHYANQKNSGEVISRQLFRWHLSQPRLTRPSPHLFQRRRSGRRPDVNSSRRHRSFWTPTSCFPIEIAHKLLK